MFKLFSYRTPKRAQYVLIQCSCKFSKEPNAEEFKHKLSVDPKEYVKSLQKRVSHPTEVHKDDLKWRTAWHEKNLYYYDTLRTFYSSTSNRGFMKFLQQPIDFSPNKVLGWFRKKQDIYEDLMQRYIPERHNILGPELAAAHFIVYRGGAVKFHNEDKWIRAKNGHYELPEKYKVGMYLQAIDCTNMKLRYDGLSNLRGLKNVEWLSLRGCHLLDDFAVDAVSNMFSHSLFYLDLRDCFGITERGIGALYKMPNLKVLYLDDFLKDTKYEMTCLLLEEVNQNLLIKSDVVTFEIKH